MTKKMQLNCVQSSVTVKVASANLVALIMRLRLAECATLSSIPTALLVIFFGAEHELLIDSSTVDLGPQPVGYSLTSGSYHFS